VIIKVNVEVAGDDEFMRRSASKKNEKKLKSLKKQSTA